jgi:hypothetical protein
VNRALAALEKLGVPAAAADVQQITALARQNDTAAVEATEKVLRCYTIADLLVDSDGLGRVALGGPQATLMNRDGKFS